MAGLLSVLLMVGSARGEDAASGALEQQTLTGNWGSVRPALSEHGLKPYLTYTSMLWGNVNGGQATGVQVNGYLDFGLDVDLAKLGFWQGFGAHADFH
ncbi:MAG: hypothetical protein ABI629_09285 [bacterium]